MTPSLHLKKLNLQVDYSGFMTINPQRFGQKYVGKVILFYHSFLH
jgi:double-strand break repair protein MRE11